MQSNNVVVLIGRLVRDPELRHTPSGTAVCTFSIAVDRLAQKDREKQTDFIDIVAWRQTAEFISKYFSKGKLISLCGSIQTRTYQDKNGNNRKAFEVVADSASFCGSKNENGGGYSAPKQSAPAQAPRNYDPVPVSDDDFTVIDDTEDLPWE